MKVNKNYWGKNILSILMYAVLLSKRLWEELIFNRKLVIGGFHFIYANEKDTQW